MRRPVTRQLFTNPVDPRAMICQAIGIPDPTKAHGIILTGKARGPRWMLNRGLHSRHLKGLGYDAGRLRQLGFDEGALEQLGFSTAGKSAGKHTEHHISGGDPKLRQFIASGKRAHALRSLGYTVHDCKHAGFSASELVGIGYNLHELAHVCNAVELRRADFNPRELREYFSGHELKRAGFTAFDLRLAGYSPRELMKLGYNDNHIRSAGFSMHELVRDGITKTARRMH